MRYYRLTVPTGWYGKIVAGSDLSSTTCRHQRVEVEKGGSRRRHQHSSTRPRKFRNRSNVARGKNSKNCWKMMPDRRHWRISDVPWTLIGNRMYMRKWYGIQTRHISLFRVDFYLLLTRFGTVWSGCRQISITSGFGFWTLVFSAFKTVRPKFNEIPVYIC